MANIAAATCPVKDAHSAQAYLIDKHLITSITDIDRQKVIDILLTVTTYKNVSIEVQAAIRAIAFLLNGDDAQTDVQTSASALEDKIASSIKSLTDTALTAFTDKLTDAQKFIEATTVSQAEITLKITQTLTNCSALETALATATAKLENIAAAPAPTQGPRTWADIAAAAPNNARNTPQQAYDPSQSTEVTRLRQRLLIRNRMIMIEPSTINDRPAAEIREMVNSWMKAYDEVSEDTDKPKTIVKAATPQPRGGLLLEFDSGDSANRFRDYIATDQELSEKFGPDAYISEQTHKIVLRFIPCGGPFDPTDPDHLRELEENSGLEPYSITSMTWCRPIAKRAANQSFATATAIINSPQAANHLLHGNIYIYDKRITIQKDARQPLLCNKCQQFGHIRRECPNELKCVACAGPHDISTCTNRDRPSCVSCGASSTHSSNAQRCPAFQRRLDDMRKRFPEDALPFFPVLDDPSTWTGAPSAPAPGPVAAQPQYNRPPRPANLQPAQNGPNLAAPTELFMRQQSLYELNNRPRHQPQTGPPPPPPNAARPRSPFLPSQTRDDSTDREIMENDTITTGARANTGLPPKPPATFEDSLPQSLPK